MSRTTGEDQWDISPTGNGPTKTSCPITTKKGSTTSVPSVFRHHIGNAPDAEFPAEPDRYHLYCAVACPWAHRTTLMRTLKKLKSIVTLTNTFQEPGGQGWSFGEAGHIVPGTDRRVRWLHGFTRSPIRPARRASPCRRCGMPDPPHRQQQVVRDHSHFQHGISGIAQPTPDYHPEPLRSEIDATNALVLKGVNDAVNGCGYSITQAAYDGSVALLFETLSGLEERLARQRYLCGEAETEADWRLFPSLVRFDPCYYVGYKCNIRRLEEYPNLSNYLRDLYQTPGIADVCDIDGMKRSVSARPARSAPTASSRPALRSTIGGHRIAPALLGPIEAKQDMIIKRIKRT